MTAMECNAENVIRDVILGPCDRPVLFMKQMAHHLVEISRDFFKHTHNVLLTRDPVDMLPSLVKPAQNTHLARYGLQNTSPAFT